MASEVRVSQRIPGRERVRARPGEQVGAYQVTTISSIYPSTQRQITNWLLRHAKYLVLASSQAAQADHCSTLGLSGLSFRRRAKRRNPFSRFFRRRGFLIFAVCSAQPRELRPPTTSQDPACASTGLSANMT